MRKILATAVLALAACASAPEQKGPPPPLAVQVESRKAEVTKQSLTEATVTVEAAALAPEAGVTATGAHWELVLDGNVIATGEQKLGTPISTTEPTVLQLEGGATVAKDAQAVQALSAHRGGFPIALRGTLDFAGANGATGKAEFAKSSFLREPRMPQVVVIDVGASHYDDGHVNLTFNLGLDNPNPFPVDVVGFKYKIAVNGQPVADATAGAQTEVPPSSKKVLEVTEQLDPKTFKDLERIYKSNSMSYRLTGELDVGLAKFDVDIGSPINFTH
jgi:LEA14-like dessication related protein